MLQITSLQDERALAAYIQARNLPRLAMRDGVYPNCKKALEDYATLEGRLADDLAAFAEYHTVSTAQIAPYIAQLQQAMQTICTIMEQIDTAAVAGTGAPLFGIPLPPQETVNNE